MSLLHYLGRWCRGVLGTMYDDLPVPRIIGHNLTLIIQAPRGSTKCVAIRCDMCLVPWSVLVEFALQRTESRLIF